MIITNSNAEDIGEIFSLYRVATDFQKTKNIVLWPEFKQSLIETEIAENRQWKILIDNEIACIWAVAFSDPQIWGEQNADPAVYIHRIATNPKFRGQNLVAEIVEWAKKYAVDNQKQFIRMDTVGENKSLISYYIKCGFDFIGLVKLIDTDGLPEHYHNAEVSLFEINLSDAD
ncbi:GNAT family N-acetyltransferase [Chryseobacterium vrystaatense]|uniref:Acetyltransferase (GNAT) family protein n=1 Tax=Chryseobacterium vrystaatense TaxID=307480 RepID=A0A1M5A9Z8_9FLAO|nr:GNAT family N-acetyltransferase [Chryseobacterium vrystaatense]SHF27131.1 Acetyltransferase (GNAT) family protein [Chryseobacterium vrystaatense]